MALENLGLKYRPQNFSELIGQEHVVKTLTNAIRRSKIAHSYLFSGPRGTGKTSTARILAKSLNCELGPTVEPCNKCEFCSAINNSSSLDVQEIDGASNNSVDDIRELRENVKYASNSRYKIYIIDEVHMLSKGAFNALLKTLEEPPENVIFIFATTEPNKVPATIMSRCQKLDFLLIPTKLILQHLKGIAQQENIEYEEDALFEIAKAGKGSIRDSLSVLGQIATYTENSITLESVQDVLNIINHELLFSIIKAILVREQEAALAAFEQAYEKGYEVSGFCADIIYHFRNLLLIKLLKHPRQVIEESDDYIKTMSEIAVHTTTGVVLNIIENLSTAYSNIIRSNIPKIIFEAALIKIMQPTKTILISDILHKINDLEKMILDAPPLPAAAPAAPDAETKSDAPPAAVKHTKKEHNFEYYKRIWDSQFIPQIMSRDSVLGNILSDSDFVSIKNGAVLVNTDDTGFSFLNKKDIRARFEKELGNLFSIPVRLNIGKKPAEEKAPRVIEEPGLIDKMVEKNETVKNVLDIFGGTIEKVERIDD